MDFFELVQERRSVRVFEKTPVPADALRRILDACNQAPSAGDLQAYEIYLVEQPGVKEALAAAAFDQEFIATAPAALVFCAAPDRARRYQERGRTLYAIQDATIAAAYAQLAAVNAGLATCWVGAFDEVRVRGALGLPADQKPVAILPLGKAAETPERTPRRSIEDLVHRL